MKKYRVDVPIAGYVSIEVEAESREDAINKALEKGYTEDEIMEIDMYDKLVEGNVCYTYHYKAEATEIPGDEE